MRPGGGTYQLEREGQEASDGSSGSSVLLEVTSSTDVRKCGLAPFLSSSRLNAMLEDGEVDA